MNQEFDDEDPFAEDIFPLKEVPSKLPELQKIFEAGAAMLKPEPIVDSVQALCIGIERPEVGGEYIIRFRCAWLFNSLAPWSMEIRTTDKEVLKTYEIDGVYSLSLNPVS